jgi:hypothetical protein
MFGRLRTSVAILDTASVTTSDAESELKLEASSGSDPEFELESLSEATDDFADVMGASPYAADAMDDDVMGASPYAADAMDDDPIGCGSSFEIISAIAPKCGCGSSFETLTEVLDHYHVAFGLLPAGTPPATPPAAMQLPGPDGAAGPPGFDFDGTHGYRDDDTLSFRRSRSRSRSTSVTRSRSSSPLVLFTPQRRRRHAAPLEALVSPSTAATMGRHAIRMAMTLREALACYDGESDWLIGVIGIEELPNLCPLVDCGIAGAADEAMIELPNISPSAFVIPLYWGFIAEKSV